MDLSDLLISYLKLFKVEYVFGVPGGAISPLYDALARSEKRGEDGPRAIVSRQESGGVFMADGYARETGKIGVCCATTGPGTTNMITGISSAYADHIPILAITGQTAITSFSRGSLQESSIDAIDTVAMLSHCTRYSTIVSHPEQFENKLAKAFTMALQPPKGPVHLSVPLDVFRSHTNTQIAFPNLNKLLIEPSTVDFVAVKKLCQEISQILTNQRKVIIVVGYEGRNAVEEIVEFAELISAHIVTTPGGKSCGFDFYNPLILGVWGFGGHDSALKALVDDSVDLILAVGTNLDEFSTGRWDPNVLMNNKLVHIQESPLYFARSPMARLHINGNIKKTFQELKKHFQTTTVSKKILPLQNNSLKSQNDKSESPQHVLTNDKILKKHDNFIRTQEQNGEPKSGQEQRIKRLYRRCAPSHIEVNTPEFFRRQANVSLPIKAQRLMCDLVQRFPTDTRFLADAGNSFVWAIHYLFPNKGGICYLSMGLCSMGWAIGASIGVFLGRKAAKEKHPVVVCITGDGSYLMNGQEITVAVAHKLTVIFVVLNDHSLGMVKHGQHLTGSESIGCEISPVNFCGIAKAMGADGYVIQDVCDFDMINFDLITAPSYGPTLLDVRVDENEIPPMGMRVIEIKSAQSPYLFKPRTEDIKKHEKTLLARAKLLKKDWNTPYFYSEDEKEKDKDRYGKNKDKDGKDD